jgi:tetratricopeptide (TPR) repeat protein
LKDILARATAPDARDRYPTAVAFASDLRRHLSDQPLRGVGNRSLPERWRKWRRRRPLALPLILTLAALLSFGVGLTLRMDRQADRARVALGEAEEHLAGGRYAEAERAGRGGEELLDGVPLRGPLRSRLREVRRAAERGLAADELHVLCERVRPLYTAPASAATQVRAAELRCRELWDDRDRLVRLLAGQSPTEAERRWRLDLLDLGILTAHLGVRLAQPGGLTAARRRALDTLAEAEALLGSSPVLYRERAGYARALGMGALADEADRLADRLPPRSAWEYTASGRAALASGDLARASADLDRAVAQEPGSFWPNYHRGVCRLRMGEPAEALASFGACVSLAPANAWCFYNRGLAYAELGRLESARADFDRAIALDRDFEAAYHAKAAVEHRR